MLVAVCCLRLGDGAPAVTLMTRLMRFSPFPTLSLFMTLYLPLMQQPAAVQLTPEETI